MGRVWLICIVRSVAYGAVGRTLSPAEISAAGMAMSDPVCHQTLETFAGLLGSAAANFALTVGARGGVYLGGGWWRNCRAFSRPAHCVGFDERGDLSTMFKQYPCI